MRNKVLPYNPALKLLARKLRKESTLAEILLWKQIKDRRLGVQFHRQMPIDEYIVDFYCHELMFAIEIDGISHFDTQKDIERQTKLEQLGVRFLSFADYTVKKDMDNVVWAITGMIEQLQRE